ncbi:MAG: hypothetical protein ACF8Q5_06870 [Phycisphaerales bacterium JB040]
MTFQLNHGESAQCSSCGYRLTGLPVGSVCPECGTPSRSSYTVRFADNLSDAPTHYLRTLRLGLLLMTLASGAGVAAMVYSVVYAFTRAGTLVAIANFQHYIAATFMGVSLIWVFGVWLATRARPLGDRTVRDYILESRRVRACALFCQFAAPAAVLLLWSLNFAKPGTVGMWALFALALLALAGTAGALVPLAVYLSSLADWAGDSGLGGKLRGAAWIIVVLGSLGAVAFVGALVPHPLAGFFNLISVYGIIMTALAVAAIALAILRLTLTTQWAIINSGSLAARDRRLLEKYNAHHEFMAARSEGRSVPHANPAAPGRCSGCGLDLSNMGSSGTCPACHRVFVKEEIPWTPDDLNRGIPVDGVSPGEAHLAPRTPSIHHTQRSITRDRVRYRAHHDEFGVPVRADTPPLEPHREETREPPGIDDELDNLPEGPAGTDRSGPPGPPPGR